MKGAGRFGSVRALTVCTAGDALGDWLNFRHREASMLEAESSGMCVAEVCVAWDAQRRLELSEVHDECSFGDSAGGVGYGYAFSCEDAARGGATEEDGSGAGVLSEVYGGDAATVCEAVDGGGKSAVVAGSRDVSREGDELPSAQL